MKLRCIEETHSPDLSFLFKIGDEVSGLGIERSGELVLEKENLLELVKGNCHFEEVI